MKTGSDVGASGQLVDSTVTAMSPTPSSDASTNSNSDPFAEGFAQSADTGVSPSKTHSS